MDGGPERARFLLASPPTGTVTEDWGRGGAWHAEAMAIGVLGGEGELRTGGDAGADNTDQRNKHQ